MTEPTTKEPDKKPFLYVVVCACGIAGDVGTLITVAQERHSGAGVVATPTGVGLPRRRGHRGPDRLPDPLGLAHTR